MTFEELPLIPQLQKNVRASGYTVPTPIQREAIPVVLEGRDLLGCAQTGTGKTAAFALPILQHLAKKPAPAGRIRPIRCLILTPTRELAQQIQDNIAELGQGLPVTSTVIYGGVNQNSQVDALRAGCDIVTACPGRLWDLMGQGYVALDDVEIFVLDEADRMLDMGFIHDVRRIADRLPKERQTLMFSATMPEEVEKLAMDLLRDPASVKVDPVSSPVQAIDQCLYYIDKGNKKYLLAQILQDPDVENALVFSRTKHGADRIVRDLKKAGIEAVAIHGDKSQNARQNALNSFKSGESRVLIATDIAARGIDIVGLSHVINYDLPMEPEAYVHRIGRTGRAGRTGKAISFCCIDEIKQLHQVEKLIGHRIPLRESEWPMLITTPSEPKPRGPLPSKLNMRGEAMPEKKPVRAREAVRPALPKSGQTITIGRNGKLVSPASGAAPSDRPRQSARPIQNGRPAQSARPSQTGRSAQGSRASQPQPIRRVSRRNKT